MAVHPPKHERLDLATNTNVDPKGIARTIAEHRLEPFGLYIARPTPGRSQFHYLESWLLPSLGLKITDFWFNPGHERDQNFYLDVVTIDVDGDVWRTTDLYLDLVLRTGHGVEVLDTDELLAAIVAGHLTQEQAHAALDTAFATVDALASHDYDLTRWLAATDIHLTWHRHP
ncbi:DUF402 domain-containing protein [Saccharomonospora iraqiensis]|uniref:DUF402 domain-containing protein n=1 Tax=Saccharomonospora iraqiensis TaxID=52698 RepID=UPI00022E4CB8|nr:DUF402 domain-containing protein [Saccharomonospora iraqiensis]